MITNFGIYGAPRFIKIAAGGHHNVVISEDGDVFASGRNDRCQCGIKSQNHHKYVDNPVHLFTVDIKDVDIKCGLNHNVVRDGDKYFLWGCNEYHQCLDKHYDMIYMKNLVKIPEVFESIQGWNKYDIICIYPGYNETRIVTKNRV